MERLVLKLKIKNLNFKLNLIFYFFKGKDLSHIIVHIDMDQFFIAVEIRDVCVFNNNFN